MYKKRGLLFLLLVLVIVISGCTEVSEETESEGAEKATGHGVIICDQDYPCGNADNICPEDYGAVCEVQDPDCK